MSDSYQAIFDAVCARIGNPNIADAVAQAIGVQAQGLSYAIEAVKHEYAHAAGELRRPCVLFRPALSIDGNQWCALYGDDLQCGVAGFGDSPELAMQDFDANWRASPGAPT